MRATTAKDGNRDHDVIAIFGAPESMPLSWALARTVLVAGFLAPTRAFGLPGARTEVDPTEEDMSSNDDDALAWWISGIDSFAHESRITIENKG